MRRNILSILLCFVIVTAVFAVALSMNVSAKGTCGSSNSGIESGPQTDVKEGTFYVNQGEIQYEEGKPVIRLFTTTWCPHCKWIKDTFDKVVNEYVQSGEIIAYHWEVDTGDNSLTTKVETDVPQSELVIFKTFNPRGSIPTYVFGEKYWRIGNGYERKNDLVAEEYEFRTIIEKLIDNKDPSEIPVSKPDYINLNVEESRDIIDTNEEIVILDVRTPLEYESGHIPDAISIPLLNLKQRIDELNKDDVVLVYCKGGSRSEEACKILAQYEFESVYNMLGGIDAWVFAGFEVTEPSTEKMEYNGNDQIADDTDQDTVLTILTEETSSKNENAAILVLAIMGIIALIITRALISIKKVGANTEDQRKKKNVTRMLGGLLGIMLLIAVFAVAMPAIVVAESVDLDGDGFTDDVDCDDTDPAAYPGADEICDGVDNDCDGDVDEDGACTAVCGNGVVESGEECDDGNTASGDGCSATCTEEGPDPVDLDGDGFTDDDDCDDTDPAVNPGADEICDGVDNDCDGLVDEDAGCGAICGNGIVESGEECDDGNTVSGDGCSASCTLEECTVNADCNDNIECTDDICQMGECLNTPSAAGTACGDSGPCYNQDICDGSGTCVDQGFADEGTPCDDADPMTYPDTCQYGACTGPAAPDSDGDGVPDYLDVCEGGDDEVDTDSDSFPDACDNCPNIPNTDQTDTDNDAIGDACDMDSEVCVYVGGDLYKHLNCYYDDSACIAPSLLYCVEECGNGILESGEECDDGNTVSGDGCSATCTEEVPDSDGDGFNDDEDNCPNNPNPDQTDTDSDGIGDACDTEDCYYDGDCDDGLYCNGVETCIAGVCQAGTQVDCSWADEQCNYATCNEDTDSCELSTPKPDGIECNDNNPCIVGETCQAGVCTGGSPPDCSGAGDQCNNAMCDLEGAEGNCDYLIPVQDDTPCTDGDPMTYPDTCQSGTCTGPAAPDSDYDGVPDYLDVCEGGDDAVDTDGDTVPDYCDECPDDPDKIESGACGCGLPDTDSDSDGTPDCNDACANDPDKTSPGVCGCGVTDADSDGDGTPNCNDDCPNDPDKIEPGACGCGAADTDSDSDGTPDCNDGCPNDPDKTMPGVCGCGVVDTDSDSDSYPDCNDNCPSIPNPDQADSDGNGVGDACEPNTPPGNDVEVSPLDEILMYFQQVIEEGL
ncbi:MAG: DUF4215 domain-containing protein, partial [Thermoplasmata archaeon]